MLVKGSWEPPKLRSELELHRIRHPPQMGSGPNLVGRSTGFRWSSWNGAKVGFRVQNHVSWKTPMREHGGL